MQTDVGNFVVQNISGNTLQRDLSTLAITDAFEGALFAYREWNLEAEQPEFELHGRLTIVAITEVEAEFAATQLYDFNNDEALELYSETCTWRYASAACGDHGGDQCEHSWTTCRQQARFHAILNIMRTDMIPSDDIVSARRVQRRRQV